MIEKPLATSLADAEVLVALARARGAVLQVGHIERFNPALSALDGLPLRPRYIASERLSSYTFRSTDIGVVLDLMIHDLDLVLSLVPTPVRSVAAVGVSVFGGHEDIANARVEFEDGCVANLSASRASYVAARKMRLWGPEGYATIDFAAKQGTLVRPSEQLRQGQLDLGRLSTCRSRPLSRSISSARSSASTRCRPRGASRWRWNSRTLSGRSARDRVPVSAARMRSALCVSPTRSSGVSTAGSGRIPGGPTGPHDLPAPLGTTPPSPALRGPISWRNARSRQNSPLPPGAGSGTGTGPGPRSS